MNWGTMQVIEQNKKRFVVCLMAAFCLLSLPCLAQGTPSATPPSRPEPLPYSGNRLANIDLNSNPYAGTEHDTNKSLRDFALERIMARRENRSQLAQSDRDMRRAVGPNGFHPELRKAVQAFIRFDVESAGGRPSARAFFQEARDLLLYASSPQTILETPAEASERRNAAAIQARIAQAAGIILNGS
jgi:hypothetical protein